MQETMRRKESQAAMRENMEMAERKKRNHELERAREKSITGSSVASEKQWWNYGASSDKVCCGCFICFLALVLRVVSAYVMNN